MSEPARSRPRPAVPPPNPEHVSGPLARVVDELFAKPAPLCALCRASERTDGSLFCDACRGER